MKATSYGKYDVFDDDQDLTWEATERRALEARGKKAPPPTAPPNERTVPRAPKPDPVPTELLLPTVEPVKPPKPRELQILDRALILLIHIRERVLHENPEVVQWITEVLEHARKEAPSPKAPPRILTEGDGRHNPDKEERTPA